MSVSFGEKGVKTKYQYRYPKEEPLNDKEHVYTYMIARVRLASICTHLLDTHSIGLRKIARNLELK